MSDSALRLLQELVEIESPTGSPGVRAVSERVAAELEALGGAASFDAAGHLRLDFAGEGAPLVLLAHSDTVWPLGTLARLPFRAEDGRAYGPGVYDMKAGLVTAVEALRLARAPGAPAHRAVRVLVTADEEVGSVSAGSAIAAAAQGAAAALVLEPCLPGGGVKVWRKGIGRFQLHVQGRAAHAGTQPSPGVSAVQELAHQVIALHALADIETGVSLNVGVVRGGTAENVIPERAEALIDVRIARTEQMAPLEAQLRGLAPVHREARLRVEGAWTRPPLEATAGSEALYAAAARHAQALGFHLLKGGSGGGSDGNLIAAHGVPVLDGLGPDGGGAHAETEHLLLDSLPQRAALVARLLADPGVA